jgi:hypothetical protein
MIDKEKITPGWVESVSRQSRNADKILVEKVIRALLLLEGLVKQKLFFVFKGGTAVMLHLKSARRLSIDLDIILPERPEDLDEILARAATVQGFLRKEEQKRNTEINIDKRHYKFFYNPVHISRKEEESILLDIHFEKNLYARIEEVNIQSSFLPETGPPLTVKTPCIEDITGDKLTAFAPKTTGIPYYKREDSMSMEIIKQLYDLGNLFDHVSDMTIVKSTYETIAKTEMEYRRLNDLTVQDVLDDTFQTALCIATRGKYGNARFEELKNGIKRVSRYIFSENYHLEKAITHASKVAYLATLIQKDAGKIERFTDPLSMKDWIISDLQYTWLNKLKKSNPEAFFYWYKIFALLNPGKQR